MTDRYNPEHDAKTLADELDNVPRELWVMYLQIVLNKAYVHGLFEGRK